MFIVNLYSFIFSLSSPKALSSSEELDNESSSASDSQEFEEGEFSCDSLEEEDKSVDNDDDMNYFRNRFQRNQVSRSSGSERKETPC